MRIYLAGITALLTGLCWIVPVQSAAPDPNAQRDARRDAWQRPAEVFDALAVKTGDRVADIGAGSGYFTVKLAERVGSQGIVYANEIDAKDLEIIGDKKKALQLSQVVLLQGESGNPKLPRGELDVVLIVDAYHEFRQPNTMIKHIRAALRTGGRLGIIDGTANPDQARENSTTKHTIGLQQVREEVVAGGFAFQGEESGFHDPDYDKPMFFLIFEKTN